MSSELLITEHPEDEAFNRRLDLFRRNGEWLTEHGSPFLARFAGQYIVVSEGEVFFSEDASEARQLALPNNYIVTTYQKRVK